MKTPEDVRALLKRRFVLRRRRWLGQAPDDWPMEIPLSIPSEDDAFRDYDAVRSWAQAWKAWTGPGTLQWAERRWRDLGAQRLPEKLILADADQLAACAGEGQRWRRTCQRFSALTAAWPTLQSVLPKHFDVLADYEDAEYQRLTDMLRWLIANPASKLYPRQLPIAGLDSKWLEMRTGFVTELVAAAQGATAAGMDFYGVCGLKPPPAAIRFRVLDRQARNILGGLSDIAASPAEIASLQLPLRRAYVVENIQSGLAFPEMDGVIIFMGLGYSVDVLAAIPWLRALECIYWGDCDTHGFAILSRIRSCLPGIRSVLMDEVTLLAHKDLWGVEADPHPAQTLPGLTADEVKVYSALKQGQWAERLRLEQERIAWPYAVERLI